MVGIYKITNTLNNKCYIGQSIDIETRWKQHAYNATHEVEKEKRRKLYEAFHSFNLENFVFEIIEECEMIQKILNERERYWISYYNSYENGYNMTKGGQGEDSWIYDPVMIRQLWDEGYSTKEIQEIIGCGKSTVNNRLKGYSDYNNTTSHSRGALLGIKRGTMNPLQKSTNYFFSNNQFLYFSEVNPVHQYTLMGEYVTSYSSVSEAGRVFVGIKPGCENNISHCLSNNYTQKTAYGYQWSKEKVDKMSPCPVPHGRLIKCLNTNELFSSSVEAAKTYGIKSRSNITECCLHKRHSAGKHPETGEKLHWEYVE